MAITTVIGCCCNKEAREKQSGKIIMGLTAELIVGIVLVIIAKHNNLSQNHFVTLAGSIEVTLPIMIIISGLVQYYLNKKCQTSDRASS